jgi:hypothetical protein
VVVPVWSSYEELWWEAAGAFRSRLDAEGSLSGSYLGRMPARASKQGGGSMQTVVRAVQWVPPAGPLQRGHAARLAELAHPHLLPLLGVCEDSCHIVYERMPVRAPPCTIAAPEPLHAEIANPAQSA